MLSVQNSAVESVPPSRPGVRGCSDVGVGDVRIPDSCCRHHHAGTLAVEPAIARSTTSRATWSSGSVPEECGGALNMATESILINTVEPAPAINAPQTLAARTW